MKMEYYEEFVKLAETGSFSKAAESLPFSQAALTQHVQQMEKLLGAKLFNRSTRKVELSEYGKLILPHAKRMVKLKSEALSAVSQQLANKHFDLAIGFYPTAARYDFIDKLHYFQSTHPDISIRYRELLHDSLIESMEMGEFDFIIQEENDKEIDGRYDRLCLNKDTLAAVLPNTHPLAGYSEVLLTQLAKDSLLMQPEHTFVYSLATSACKEMGFSPTVTYTSYSINNIINNLNKNNCVSLMIKTPALRYKTLDVAIVDLIPPIFSSVNLLYHESKLNKAGRCFLEFMMKQIESEQDRSK